MIYKFTIAPKGAMGTPLRSDTLFGHACWAIRMNENTERFSEFIQNAATQQPELVFSGGFPEAWFPRPILPVKFNRNMSKEAFQLAKKNTKSNLVLLKQAHDNGWDTVKLLSETNGGGTTKTSQKDTDYSNHPFQESLLHNVIDRTTGTSLPNNGLYNTDSLWYSGIWETVDIYVSTTWSRDTLSDFITTMFSVGYGRDQTIGMGEIEIVTKPEKLDFPEIKTDWYLSLSHAVPCNNINLHMSFYQLETKYGKVWSALEKQKSPFKKVLLQTIPGSVFNVSNQIERAGCVLRNIHDNPDVIENCMTILYPLPASALKEVVSC